jgi:hypothetical protein
VPSFDTSIFSPDTYHAAILAALKQSAASQDARYLNMLATMNGMGKKPIPDLQAGIVHKLPDAPLGYINPGPIAATLLSPPANAPVQPIVAQRHLGDPIPSGSGGLPGDPDTAALIDTPSPGGGTGDGSPGSSPSDVATAPDQSSPEVTTAPQETAAPTETAQATPNDAPSTPTDPSTPTAPAQVASPAPTGFPTTPTGYLFGPPDFAAPPAPPSTPLNQPDFGVVVAPDDQNVSPDLAAPAPSINVDVNGNQVASPTSSLNSPGYQVSGLPSEMSTNPGDLGLNGFNQGVLDATSTNQASKGDSLNANAMTANPTTTVTVAPPDLNAPGFLAPGKSQQEAEQQNDDTAAPAPGLLASVFDAVTGNPAANNPGNALAAMNAANQAQSEQAAANVAAMNSPGLISANLSSMNDVSNALSNPSSFNVSNDFSSGFNVAGPVTGSLYGSGFMGDQGVLAGDLSSATNMNANTAALMDTVNTDFNAPGFEQDASNNAAQTAISTALDNAATNAISQEADTSSPSAAPTGYSPGDMGFSGLDGGLGTGLAGAVAGPGFGGDQAASSGFGGVNAGGFASDVTGGFNADAASTAAAATAANDTGGLGGVTGGFGGFGGISAGFGLMQMPALMQRRCRRWPWCGCERR